MEEVFTTLLWRVVKVKTKLQKSTGESLTQSEICLYDKGFLVFLIFTGVNLGPCAKSLRGKTFPHKYSSQNKRNLNNRSFSGCRV